MWRKVIARGADAVEIGACQVLGAESADVTLTPPVGKLIESFQCLFGQFKHCDKCCEGLAHMQYIGKGVDGVQTVRLSNLRSTDKIAHVSAIEFSFNVHGTEHVLVDHIAVPEVGVQLVVELLKMEPEPEIVVEPVVEFVAILEELEAVELEVVVDDATPVIEPVALEQEPIVVVEDTTPRYWMDGAPIVVQEPVVEQPPIVVEETLMQQEVVEPVAVETIEQVLVDHIAVPEIVVEPVTEFAAIVESAEPIVAIVDDATPVEAIVEEPTIIADVEPVQQEIVLEEVVEQPPIIVEEIPAVETLEQVQMDDSTPIEVVCGCGRSTIGTGCCGVCTRNSCSVEIVIVAESQVEPVIVDVVEEPAVVVE